jgi:hypothetical protein
MSLLLYSLVIRTVQRKQRYAGRATSGCCCLQHAYVVLLHFLHGAVICVPVFISAERSIWLRVFHRPPADTFTRFFVYTAVCSLFVRTPNCVLLALQHCGQLLDWSVYIQVVFVPLSALVRFYLGFMSSGCDAGPLGVSRRFEGA